MLIYVSCETPEQITDYLHFKLRSMFLHGSMYCSGQKMAPHVNKWSQLDGAHE